MLDTEKWKAISGYEGYYEVSSEGRVKSLPREIICNNGSVRHLRGKILKPMIDVNGYEFVMLAYEGKQKSKFVHRLVAEAYLDRLDPAFEVNHIDGNKRNNCVSNLEWISHKQNIQHSFNTGLHKKYQSDYMRRIGLVGNKVSISKSSVAVLCVSDGVAFVSQNSADRYYGYYLGSVCDAIKHRNGVFKGKVFRKLSEEEKHNFTLLS